MTSLTLAAVGLLLVAVAFRGSSPRVLAIGGAAPIGAALVVGGTAIPVFYFIALGIPIVLATRLLSRSRQRLRGDTRSVPGLAYLILFSAWAVIVTAVAPQVFGGTEVLASDGSISLLRPGSFTSSNVAQVAYLTISVLVVVYLARTTQGVSAGLIGVTTGLVTLLSLWRLLSIYAGVPFPEGLFDNSPAYSFVDAAPGGQVRFRGIFSEPSGLAVSCLVTIAYTASRATRVRGWHRAGLVVLGAVASLLAVLSTSATFVVASVVLAGIAAAAAIIRVVVRGGHLGAVTVTIGCLLGVAGLWLLPIVTNLVQGVIDDKVSSSSFDERSGADARSFELVWETYGFGVGLGSHRPSSFFAGLLAATGILGVALFALAVASVIRRALPIDEYRPVVWALVALLITKVIASPDLSDSSGLLWMSIGLLAHAGLQRRSGLDRKKPSTSFVGRGRHAPTAIDSTNARAQEI